MLEPSDACTISDSRLTSLGLAAKTLAACGVLEVEVVRPVSARDLEGIAETLGGDKPHQHASRPALMTTVVSRARKAISSTEMPDVAITLRTLCSKSAVVVSGLRNDDFPALGDDPRLGGGGAASALYAAQARFLLSAELAARQRVAATVGRVRSGGAQVLRSLDRPIEL
jgi:hypothetical protein